LRGNGPKIAPIHLSEILLEEFMSPLGISQYRLAKETSVPPRRINEIVRGLRSISAETALLLARYFGTSEQFWLNLQPRHDLEIEKIALGRACTAKCGNVPWSRWRLSSRKIDV
jgi:addiction module HigA family antidote